jgi:chorismate synthase
MAELRFLTAGESHGPALMGIIEGLPAGLPLVPRDIDTELRRRQRGHGRGRRMSLERDSVEILGGIIQGKTVGSPLSMLIVNHVRKTGAKTDLPVPRPGHADLAGVLKYRFEDAYPVSERASARETAMRVAVGAVARKLLKALDIEIYSFTVGIGTVRAGAAGDSIAELRKRAETSAVRCPDRAATREMVALIDQAGAAGDTLGGILEVIADRVPPGLGSYVHWDRRMDGRLAQALMSIPSAKAVEVGDGIAVSEARGSAAHDAILVRKRGGRTPSAGDRHHLTERATNRAGGIEGGVTNGERLVVRVRHKPISTLRSPLASVAFATGKATLAPYRRSDVCVVPAAGVVAEAMVAWVLAAAVMEKFGGDSLAELLDFYAAWRKAAGRPARS